MAFPNEPERTDLDRLFEVQQDVVRAIEIGEPFAELVERLKEASRPLYTGEIIPGDDIRNKWLEEVGSAVYGLERAVQQAFEGLGDNLMNPIYLGNISVRRALREGQ